MGSAAIAKPFGGSFSRFATFSNTGMLASKRATWLPKSSDCPWSMLGVSRPMALMLRSLASQAAASGWSPGKWSSGTASGPVMAVPR